MCGPASHEMRLCGEPAWSSARLGRVKEDCRESRGTSFLETTVQDIRYALRQLRKTPAFTVTVLLTLALGIGANAAIFTLVNAVLLKNLPVVDPGTLYRLGDNNACCLNGGVQANDGDYTLFSTDTYEQFRKNTPEFEELAAMQAGFGFDPIVVRRAGTQTEARSAAGEFVSGNYFRTFGLQAAAGRLLADEDDRRGAPIAAVMSYEAWQRDYAADTSVIGSTFYVNTKPVTLVGVAAKGFFGDRLSSMPPEFYLPIESMPVLTNAPYVHQADTRWLYMVGRIKPGVAIAPLQQKLSGLLRQTLATTRGFTSERGKAVLARAHVVLTPGGAGIRDMQEQYGSQLHLLMWIAGLVLSDCLRQHCQSFAGARDGTTRGDVCAFCAGSGAGQNRPSTADGERVVGSNGRHRWVGGRLRRYAHAADAGFSRSTDRAHPCQSVDFGDRVCVWAVARDRGSVRGGAGLDRGSG